MRRQSARFGGKDSPFDGEDADNHPERARVGEGVYRRSRASNDQLPKLR